jgi:hypothetical protein
VVRPHQVRGYENHADDMRLELIPGVGHFTPEEAPELVVDCVMEHFESATPSAHANPVPARPRLPRTCPSRD